jgi:lysyl-tRNA synthetase class 2
MDKSSEPRPYFLDDLARRRHFFEARAFFLGDVRAFFRRRGFLEVDAPNLVPAAGMEPHLDAFEVRGTATGRGAFLPTSPEFYLKKLLASGVHRCFCLAPAFRDEESSGRHSPEFLMLEWYRAGAPLGRLVEDCSGLLRTLARRFLPEGILARGGLRCDLSSGVELLDLGEAFARWAGGDWRELGGDEAWRERALTFGAQVHDGWSPNDCFSYILLTRIEPELARVGRPAVLMGYPPFQGALAREDPARPGVIERFELYMAGEELANAYAELTDGAEQRRRYFAYQKERQDLVKPLHPPDEAFFLAVDRLPECSGIALGADRLLALLLGASLRDIRHGTKVGE